MGKKAKFKAIRRAANALPEVIIKKVQGKVVNGSVLIDQGVKEVQGKPVSELQHYRQKELVDTPLNHERKMKQLYNKHGVAGVRAYMGVITEHAKKTA